MKRTVSVVLFLTMFMVQSMLAQDFGGPGGGPGGTPPDGAPNGNMPRPEQDVQKTTNSTKLSTGLKDKEKIYIFGFGTRLSDSTVYITDIMELDSALVAKKTEFLVYRSAYTLQFRQYLEGGLGEVNETCCVFFSPKRKKLAKKYYKVKRRYLDNPDKVLKVIGTDDFKFERLTLNE